MADDKLPVVPLQPDTTALGCSRRQLVRGAALAAFGAVVISLFTGDKIFPAVSNR